ncbi:hypothetical protein Tco_0704695 [Tanacetum coccineum]|uniref:Uncharacterized protein n=1 Tax=Tanacetum coccineum TaxID=301880 RepID=A0ABQ4Y2T0_9ASTR
MDSCWTCGNPFYSYENCSEEKASREERVLESYGHQSQYDYYEHDTYHVDYNTGIEDYTMYQGDYDNQYYHPAYESPSFFNQPQRSTQHYYYQGQRQDDDHLFDLNQKLDKLMSMIDSNKEENQRALETEVGWLAEQLNREETYEVGLISVMDKMELKWRLYELMVKRHGAMFWSKLFCPSSVLGCHKVCDRRQSSALDSA